MALIHWFCLTVFGAILRQGIHRDFCKCLLVAQGLVICVSIILGLGIASRSTFQIRNFSTKMISHTLPFHWRWDSHQHLLATQPNRLYGDEESGILPKKICDTCRVVKHKPAINFLALPVKSLQVHAFATSFQKNPGLKPFQCHILCCSCWNAGEATGNEQCSEAENSVMFKLLKISYNYWSWRVKCNSIITY